MKLGEDELGNAIDGHEQVELALLGADLGQIEMEIADGIGLELLLLARGDARQGQADG